MKKHQASGVKPSKGRHLDHHVNASRIPFKDTYRPELFPEEVSFFNSVFKWHSILTLKLALKSGGTKNNLGAAGFSARELVTADASCQALFGAGDKN